jgi:molybdate transport system substrate-binding protein
MKRALAWTTLASLLAASAGAVDAAEIRVVTVGGLQKGIAPIAADFTRETGHQVKFVYTNPANFQKALAAEGPFDVVVLATAPVDALDKAGKLVAGSHVRAVRGGIAVAVRDGAKKPDVSTPEALKATVLAARNVVYTDPSTPNGSGEKTKAILQKIGVWDAVVAKGRMDGLGPAKERVAKGEFEIGFFNASEAEAPGCVVAGVIPASLQEYTNYDAGVFADAAAKDAAAAFVKFLGGKAAGERWKAARMEPM